MAEGTLRFTQIEPYAGESEGRRSAPQRGVWVVGGARSSGSPTRKAAPARRVPRREKGDKTAPQDAPPDPGSTSPVT